MSHDTQLKVSFLENRLTNFEKDSNGHYNKQFVEDALTWNPVAFMTSIINSGFIPPVMKEADLPAIEVEFKSVTGQDSRREQVLGKHWLRIVLGVVEIPASTRYALGVFNEVRDSLDYLQFLLKITDKDNRNVTVVSMQEYIERHATESGVRIDVEHVVFKKFATMKDDLFQLAHPVYYKNLVEYETEFRFLDFINKRLSYGNQPVLKVQTSELKKLIEAHQLLYPATPDFEYFESHNVFVHSDTTTVVVNFNDYWTYFGDTVATPMLVNDDGWKTDRWYEIWYSQHWSRNSLFQIPRNVKEKFLDTITKRLIDDIDFVSRKDEVSKARRDGDADMHYLDDDLFTRPDHTFEDADTLYEISYTADQISNHPSSDILFVQGTRQNAARLLRLVVTNDDYFKSDKFHFLKKILAVGIDRPYLVYETETIITNDRPNVIPYLLTELALVNYGLNLVAHLEIPTNLVSVRSEEQQVKEATMHEIWRAALDIYADVIADQLKITGYDAKTLSERVFETIKLVCRLRYDHNSGFDYQKRFWESDFLVSSLDALSVFIKDGYNSTELLDAFSKSLVPRKDRSMDAHVIDLPLSDLHSLLIAGQWLVVNGRRDLAVTPVDEIKKMLSNYFNRDYSTFKERSVWGNQKSTKRFPWGSLYELLLTMNQPDILVIVPKLKIDLSLHSVPLDSVRIKPEVRFGVERVRTYVVIISEVFRYLVKARKYESRLTTWYEDFVQRYTMDMPSEGRLNVFERTYDVNNSLTTNKLLPELLYDINYFVDTSAKKRLVELLVDRLAFSQLVEMYHEISSENERALIKAKIEAADIAKVLEESRWTFDFDLAIKILAWENLLKDKINSYINELKKKGSKNEKYLLFQLQMYQCYHSNDLKGLKELSLPENPIVGYVEPAVKNGRSLFEALILAKLEKLDDADKILNELWQVSPKVIYRVNLFLNRINALKKEQPSGDRNQRLSASLSEWQTYKKNIDEAVQTDYQMIFCYYELTAFKEVGDSVAFDELYSKLPMHMKMDPEYLILRAEYLVSLGRSREADELYLDAVDYHHGRIRNLKFLDQLNSIVTSNENIQKLERAYERILSMKAHDLVKLVPNSINPNNASIGDFIRFDLEWCLKELIKRVRSVSGIKDETKYNDVVASLLSARVAGYGWTIKDNSTGNKSGGKKKNPGERDIIVQQIQSELALIECVHIYGRTAAYVAKHIQKVFPYGESKMPRFLLVYFLGPSEKFEKSWLRYRDRIFPTVKFPFEYKAHGAIEDSQSDSDAIRLGVSTHGHGHTLVHIGVNLNFSA